MASSNKEETASLAQTNTSRELSGREQLDIEQIKSRIKRINSHINTLKIFVVAFCLATVLLNTYHINKLKVFSQNLGNLMKSHTGGLVKLNVLNNIKQNRGYATGGFGYEPIPKSQNATSNHFDTNNNQNMFDKYLMANLTLKQKEELKNGYLSWMETNVRIPK